MGVGNVEESQGIPTEGQSKMTCTEGRKPRTHSVNQGRNTQDPGPPPIDSREAGETAQVTSILGSVLVNHGTILKDFDQGSNKIRGYFRKMNGGEGKN